MLALPSSVRLLHSLIVSVITISPSGNHTTPLVFVAAAALTATPMASLVAISRVLVLVLQVAVKTGADSIVSAA